MKKIVVFTDGSCMKKKDGIKCGYGVYFPNGEFDNISKKFTDNPTNQRAELYAILKALKTIKKNLQDIIYNIIIYTDSKYSIQSLTQWIIEWKKNNWKTSSGKDVMNQDIIKKIDKITEKYGGKIDYIHVFSHTKKKDFYSVSNDIADKLAKAGCN